MAEDKQLGSPINPTAPLPPSTFTSWADPLSKIGALSLVIIYAIGYLVTSINLAANGMILANPLKPRIAAAGVLFCLMFGLPMWIFREVMNKIEFPVPEMGRLAIVSVSYKFITFFGVSLLVGGALAALFSFDIPSSKWKVWVFITIIGLDYLFIFLLRSSPGLVAAVSKRRNTIGVVYLLALIILITVSFSTFQPGKFSLIQVPLWIFGCGIYLSAFGTLTSVSVGGRWPNAVAQSILPIILFATGLYPRIKSEWGGGLPVEVVVKFSKDSPVYASQNIPLRLLDESDAGLYVLRIGQKHAIFIPKADVAAIVYSSDPKDMP